MEPKTKELRIYIVGTKGLCHAGIAFNEEQILAVQKVVMSEKIEEINKKHSVNFV